MGPSAKFYRKLRIKRDHSDHIAVLFSEQGHGAHRFCFFDRHDLDVQCNIFTDLLIDQCFHLPDLLRRHGREVGEIKTKYFFIHQ